MPHLAIWQNPSLLRQAFAPEIPRRRSRGGCQGQYDSQAAGHCPAPQKQGQQDALCSRLCHDQSQTEDILCKRMKDTFSEK